ncbi:MAG: hypothetical protein DRJ10_03785 [Bacteroidetes bacterium]|nr:MAG: hypothetical protein DRJ10_03785 [Bacteroidota bacterium]RLD84807.1 MAG: hypothetical protein DRJ07_04430 [Bacteroidota bacterium]
MIGTNTLTNSEVTNISSIGFWIIIANKEYFVSFNEYPEFGNMSVQEIFNVKMLSPEQLYWEKHDIDIELSALKNPNLFPLIYK